MKRLWVLAALWMAAISPLPAEGIAAVVAKISGKAQLLKGETWVPLAVGQSLADGDTVSTGFRSELQLKIGPSTVTIKPLSRLVVRSLTQNGTALKTDLYLKVGKVDAEVNKSEAVQTQQFQVSSPVATASVRGTAFSFDGATLQVTRGLVDFSDIRGNLISVPVGESARVSFKRGNLTSNQKLVVQDSVVTAETTEDDLSWNGWSYEDLLQYLADHGWYYGGWTGVSVYGIEPKPLPVLTYVYLGGIE